MGFCPNCYEYYSGHPDVCPNCEKRLPSPEEEKPYCVPSTVKYVSKAKEFFWNIDNAENFGDYILTFSSILLAVNLLATIILAFVFGKYGFVTWYSFHFGNFLLILLSGCVYSGIVFLVTRGFGYLVKSSISTAEDSAKTLRYIQEIEKAQLMSAESKDDKGV